MTTPSAGATARLSPPSRLTFAATAIPMAALTTAIGIYLPRHLAANIGVSLAVVGSSFAIVRMIDLFIDLLLGLAMDRTTTRLGRYRAWMLIGAPITVLAVFVIFIHTPSSIASLVAWLLVLYLGTSILGLARDSWAASIAPDYDGRSRLFGLIGAAGVLGSLAMFLTPVFLARAGGGDAGTVSTMGWLIMAALPATVLLAVARIPERVRENLASPRPRLLDYWAVVSRPTFLRIAAANFCFAMGPGWLSATFLFFAIDARGFSISQANLLLAVGISSGFVGANLLSRFAVRWSKHRALIVNAIGYGVALGGLVVGPPGSLPHAVAAMAVLGFFTVTFNVLLHAMTADVADEFRLEQGQERVGLLFAISTMVAKVATALAIFLTFTVLETIGYDAKAGAANTPAALQGLAMVSILGPAAFMALGVLCFWGYRLTGERHAGILRELELRDAIASFPIPETSSAGVNPEPAPPAASPSR